MIGLSTLELGLESVWHQNQWLGVKSVARQAPWVKRGTWSYQQQKVALLILLTIQPSPSSTAMACPPPPPPIKLRDGIERYFYVGLHGRTIFGCLVRRSMDFSWQSKVLVSGFDRLFILWLSELRLKFMFNALRHCFLLIVNRQTRWKVQSQNTSKTETLIG